MASDSSHYSDSYSKDNNIWDVGSDHTGFVGGIFRVSNLSSGYHGILYQWWENYITKNAATDVLLVSENNQVKWEFSQLYPAWRIHTTDMYTEISSNGSSADIICDICNKNNPITNKYDLILNQATLEHVYNPFQAVENLCEALNKGGIMLIHTHPPSFSYHQYPRDYFRFMKDWWYDLPKYISGIELIEFYMHQNTHVFACYRKI